MLCILFVCLQLIKHTFTKLLQFKDYNLNYKIDYCFFLIFYTYKKKIKSYTGGGKNSGAPKKSHKIFFLTKTLEKVKR